MFDNCQQESNCFQLLSNCSFTFPEAWSTVICAPDSWISFYLQGSIFAGFALKTSDSSFPKPSLSTGVTLNFGSNLTFQPKSNGTSQKSASANKGDSTDNPEYLRQLKVLNENILSWIQKHVGENPYCILTPSFKDYEKHLNDLEKKYCEQGTDSSQDKSSISAPPAASPAKEPSPSVFGSSGKPMGSGFSFGQSLTSSTASKDKTASSQEEKDNKGRNIKPSLLGTFLLLLLCLFVFVGGGGGVVLYIW